jgi:NAD(P)-dependent dehydrogenase (short-subunit alcohol dehydrogenase family)
MLEDKAVFITGGARGIGYGIARAVLEAGAQVAVGDLDEQALSAARDTLISESSVTDDAVFAIVVDVVDEQSVENALTTTQSHFGYLDGLVNNAGIIQLGEDLRASAQDWRVQMEVNVIGTHNCCRTFANMLINAEQAGAIVNIASNCGKVGYPNMAGYNASKAAVINLTRSLSSELSAHNINVNAICPGGVNTPMLMECAEAVGRRIGEDPNELFKTMVPAQLGRHIEPLEIGRVTAFLLSDDANIIRGQSINADGGDTPY